MPERRRPRFNHVAMSVPADLLGDEGRSDIVAFYSEVFGWSELPTETIDRERLILSAYSYDQFVFLTASEEPMRAGRSDHFGMGVSSREELDALYEKAVAYRRKDRRVEIAERQTEQHPGLVLTSFYVGFLLPLTIEVQHFAFGSSL